jgi:hypothetical protein
LFERYCLDYRATFGDTPNDLLQRFPVSGQDGRGEEVLDLDRQFAHAHAGGVAGRRGDGGGDAGEADLADPAGAEFVDLLVRIIEEMHVDRRDSTK